MIDLRDNADAYRNRTMSPRRKLLVTLLVILLLPVLIISLLIARFDPNQYAPSLIAAVDHATGRQLSFTGPITIKLSLTPEVDVTGISLTNPPGFPDPELLTIARVSAKIALVPLLSRHLDILQLRLTQPVIRLERGPGGQANWDFSQAPAAAANPAAPVQTRGYTLALQAVTIEHGLLLLGGSHLATAVTLKLDSLNGTAASLAAPLHVQARAELGNAPFSLAGVVGPVAQFSAQRANPWPVDVNVQLGTASATVSGTVAHPRTAQGYNLNIHAKIPALADLTHILPAAWLGGWALPPLRDVTLVANIADQNATIPAITNLTITSGQSSLAPGVILDSADLHLAALSSPVTLDITGQAGGNPFQLSSSIGAPATLLNPRLLPPGPPPGSLPVAITAQLGAAKLGVNGAITNPQTLAGAALAVTGSIPDLTVFSPLAGEALPAWKHIQLQATLIDPGGLGLRAAIGVDGLAVTMDNAAFGGAGSLYFGAQPRLQLALNFNQLNLDALLAAMPAAAPAPGPATSEGNALPEFALPVRVLRAGSADVQLSADTLVWNQATYTALQGHAVLANGVLTLNPVTGQVPGGSVTAQASLDATKNPVAETLDLNAPALALSPFLKAFGLSGVAEGTVQARLTAASNGNGLPAIAAGLSGQLGLAMVNGIVDGSVMDALFGTVLRTVGLPESVAGAQGPVSVRCMALRVDAQNGIGTIRTLTLDSSRLLVQGGGSVDFGNQTLDIVLRPQLDFGGTAVGVPVQLGGTFSAPTTAVAPASAVQAAARAAIGLPITIAQETLGANTIFGKAESLLGTGQPSDVCPAALSLGRLGQPGPPAPPPTVPATNTMMKKLSGPRNLLDALFGK